MIQQNFDPKKFRTPAEQQRARETAPKDNIVQKIFQPNDAQASLRFDDIMKRAGTMIQGSQFGSFAGGLGQLGGMKLATNILDLGKTGYKLPTRKELQDKAGAFANEKMAQIKNLPTTISQEWKNRNEQHKNISPLDAVQKPIPTITPTPEPSLIPGYSDQDVIETMQSDFGYGQLPVATISAQMVRDMKSSNPKLYGKYPSLPIGQSILETSGGKNLLAKQISREDTAGNPLPPYIVPNEQRQFNKWAWALFQNDYRPKSIEEAATKYITGIGHRDPNYIKFRDTMDLNDLAATYAPASHNPGTGGYIYADKLKGINENFMNALNQRVNSRKK